MLTGPLAITLTGILFYAVVATGLLDTLLILLRKKR